MLRKALLSVLSATALILIDPSSIQAQDRCLPRHEMLKHLSAQFKETPVAIGLVDDATALEILTTADGKTWTAVLTRSNGLTCVVASGESWNYAAPHLAVKAMSATH
jgi:hypothetical protein